MGLEKERRHKPYKQPRQMSQSGWRRGQPVEEPLQCRFPAMDKQAWSSTPNALQRTIDSVRMKTLSAQAH